MTAMKEMRPALTAECSQELFDKLTALAAREDRSRASLVRLACEEYLARRENACPADRDS